MRVEEGREKELAMQLVRQKEEKELALKAKAELEQRVKGLEI